MRNKNWWRGKKAETVSLEQSGMRTTTTAANREELWAQTTNHHHLQMSKAQELYEEVPGNNNNQTVTQHNPLELTVQQQMDLYGTVAVTNRDPNNFDDILNGERLDYRPMLPSQVEYHNDNSSSAKGITSSASSTHSSGNPNQPGLPIDYHLVSQPRSRLGVSKTITTSGSTKSNASSRILFQTTSFSPLAKARHSPGRPRANTPPNAPNAPNATEPNIHAPSNLAAFHPDSVRAAMFEQARELDSERGNAVTAAEPKRNHTGTNTAPPVANEGPGVEQRTVNNPCYSDLLPPASSITRGPSVNSSSANVKSRYLDVKPYDLGAEEQGPRPRSTVIEIDSQYVEVNQPNTKPRRPRRKLKVAATVTTLAVIGGVITAVLLLQDTKNPDVTVNNNGTDNNGSIPIIPGNVLQTTTMSVTLDPTTAKANETVLSTVTPTVLLSTIAPPTGGPTAIPTVATTTATSASITTATPTNNASVVNITSTQVTPTVVTTNFLNTTASTLSASTLSPTTPFPSMGPSPYPTMSPSGGPSMRPSAFPTMTPSNGPSMGPTVLTFAPSPASTIASASTLSATTSLILTNQPSVQPTRLPTFSPSSAPTGLPSTMPTSTVTNTGTTITITTTSMVPRSSLAPSAQPTMVPSSSTRPPRTIPGVSTNDRRRNAVGPTTPINLSQSGTQAELIGRALQVKEVITNYFMSIDNMFNEKNASYWNTAKRAMNRELPSLFSAPTALSQELMRSISDDIANDLMYDYRRASNGKDIAKRVVKAHLELMRKELTAQGLSFVDVGRLIKTTEGMLAAQINLMR